MTQPRILIVGAGAVGLVWTYYFSTLPVRPFVGLVARSNYEALRQKGIVSVQSPLSGVLGGSAKPDELISSRHLDQAPQGVYDYIVITTKTVGHEAVKGLERFMAPNTLIILAQNGIGLEDPYITAYGTKVASIAACVMYVYSHMASDTAAELSHPDINCMAGVVYGNDNGSLASIAEMACKSGFKTFKTMDRQDYLKSRWAKMLPNATFNTFCAVTGLGVPELFQVPIMEELLTSCFREIYEVAKAHLKDDEWCEESKIAEWIDFGKNRYPIGNVPSALQDVRNGKELEVETLNGNVIKLADQLGVAVPTLKFLNPMLEATNLRLRLDKL